MAIMPFAARVVEPSIKVLDEFFARVDSGLYQPVNTEHTSDGCLVRCPDCADDRDIYPALDPVRLVELPGVVSCLSCGISWDIESGAVAA